jgi:hypothetical protein
MLLQTLTGLIYDITSHSWAVASIVIKYYLAAIAVYLYTGEGLTKDGFMEKTIEHSRLILAEIVLLGTVLYLFNFKPEPMFRLFSEVVALAYLGFLFWNY